MDELSIRLADLDEAGDIAAIRALTAEYARHVLGRHLETSVLDRLPQAMRDHGGVRVMLGWVSGKPVAIATCVVSFSSFAAAPVLNLHDFAVTADHRGHGVGAKMLQAMDSLARDLGCAKVTLEVIPENPARRLYARSGLSEAAIFCEKRLA